MTENCGIRLCLLAILAFLSGCTICDNCDDAAYSGYGGRWQRTDRFNGRVGSIFSQAGAPVVANDPGPVEILRSPSTKLAPTKLAPAAEYPESVDFPELKGSKRPIQDTEPSVLELMPPILEAY